MSHTDRIQKILAFLKDNPTDEFLNHALALEYINLGEVDKAKQLFVNILTHNPNYVGSYYHLAKLLRETSQLEEAKQWYEKGMIIAKQLKDNHAHSELQSAYNDMLDEDF